MTARFLKAVICGLSAGLLLLAGFSLFGLLLNGVEDMLGSAEKMPLITKVFQAIVTQNGSLFCGGLLVLTLGYGWLVWLDEPKPWQCVLHGLLVFVVWLILSGVVPHVSILKGIRERTQPSPLFELSRDLPWLVLCSSPLAIAMLISRSRGKKGLRKDCSLEATAKL